MEDDFTHNHHASYHESNLPMVVGVDMQIIDYYVVNEADTYDKHYFIIQVQVEDRKYTVDRSYVDFVELDRLLKKIHPESAVPHLPLRCFPSFSFFFFYFPLFLSFARAGPTIEKFLSKEAANQQNGSAPGSSSASSSSGSGSGSGGLFGFMGRSSFSMTRESLLASPSVKATCLANTKELKIPENSTEIIRNRMGPLTLYLTGIACYHELLVSYPFWNFLDEEYTSMLDFTIPPTLTEFDLLLLNSPMNNCTVSRIESHNIDVPAGHFLLWRFRTAKYDIGFQIEINGKVKLPLTRYRSQDHTICGAITVPVDAIVTVKWNNTYAKRERIAFPPSFLLPSFSFSRSVFLSYSFVVHSKTLTWSVRVVPREDFDRAKKQAIECEEEKHRYLEQRYALHRAALRHAATLSDIIHGSIITAEYDEQKASHLLVQQSSRSTEDENNSVEEYHQD
jgi:hypothetical protein